MLKKLEKGIDVEGRKCIPTRVKLKKNDAIKNYAIVEITIIAKRAQQINGDLKNELISKNSVAILMPYLRSEISLLTAQPETETVVLPVFNINRMMDD